MVVDVFLYGFISAFGWWTSTHYIIEPYFPPPIERKVETKEPGLAQEFIKAQEKKHNEDISACKDEQSQGNKDCSSTNVSIQRPN